MLLTIVLLNIHLGLADLGLADLGLADAETSPNLSLGSLESLVEKVVEQRLKDMERRIEDCKEGQAKEKIELEAKLKEMDRRLEELEEEIGMKRCWRLRS